MKTKDLKERLIVFLIMFIVAATLFLKGFPSITYIMVFALTPVIYWYSKGAYKKKD